MSQPVNTSFPDLFHHLPTKENLFGNLQSLAKNFFSALKNNPTPFVIGAAALGFGCYIIYSQGQQTVEALTKKIESHNNAQSYTSVHSEVKDFVKNLLQSDPSFKKECDHEHTLEYLSKKIVNAYDVDVDDRVKTVIVKNIISNFKSTIDELKERVQRDAARDDLEELGICKTPRIFDSIPVTIIPAGDESHNKGRNVFKLIFKTQEGEKTIFYKPRSMNSEYFICSNKGGLLKEVGFGTYTVIRGLDESKGYSQAYGYCSELKNIQKNNTLISYAEFEDYLGKLCILEHIASKLELTDLHFLNLITENKTPYLIDTEAVLVPNTESGLFNEQVGAAFMFKGAEEGKNRFWFEGEYEKEIKTILNKENERQIKEIQDSDIAQTQKDRAIERLNTDLSQKFIYRYKKRDLEVLGIDLNNLLRSTEGGVTKELIQPYRAKLKEDRGRIVLIPTDVLKTYLLQDSEKQAILDLFIGDIKKGMETVVSKTKSISEKDEASISPKFVFHEDAIPAIQKQLREDLLNADVPVFYYESTTDKIIYGGVTIAHLKLE